MLAVPPTHMDAEVDHDGVVWNVRRPAVPSALLVGMVALVAAALTFGATAVLFGITVAGWSSAGVALGVGLLMVPQLTKGHRLELRPDRLWLSQGRAARLEWLLKDVTVSVVESPASSGSWALLLKHAEGHELLGRGHPKEHSEWMKAAIDEAREQLEEKARADGRELFYHREAAKKVSDLAQR